MRSIRQHPAFAFLVVLVDAVCVYGSFFIAYHLRFSNLIIPATKGVPSFQNYAQAMFFVIPIYLWIFRSYRLYEPERHVRRIYELMTVVKAVSMGAFAVMALTFVYRDYSYSRAMLSLAWLISIVLCSAGRYVLIQLEYWMRIKKYRYRVLIVGMNQSARDLIRWSIEHRHYGQDVVGILTTAEVEGEVKHFEKTPILGSLDHFDSAIAKHRVDEVILSDPNIPRQIITKLMLKCESRFINFKLAADIYGLMTHYVDVEYVSTVPLLGLKALPLDDPWNRWLKRIFDAAVSSTLLIVLSPLCLGIALMIKAMDRGPVFYRQERVGRDGKSFDLIKFRTMLVGAEGKTGPVWAKQDDERVTLIGKWLRRSNLDELPQLWNVLVGNMSLVGPRPERPHFVERFKDQIPRYMARHKVKSGITGWAQIHGLRGNSSLDQRIQYDIYYMENWTLMLDIEILLATFFAYKNAY